MSEHRYPIDALLGDYVRALAGLLLTGTPLLLLTLNPYVVAVLGGLTALFAAFGVATLLRHLCRIEIGPETIIARGWVTVRLAWDALEGVRLRYFATRRDGKQGWMELTLRGNGRTLKVDSRIEDFPAIARRAAEAAGRRHLSLAPTTAANFAALGIQATMGAGE